MKIAVFGTKAYDCKFLSTRVPVELDLTFIEARLDATTVALAGGHDAVCCFVHDDLGTNVIARLGDAGVRLVLLRCAGFNNVDLSACNELGIIVMRVPAYSPYAVAEHTVGLILSLNRGIHRAYNRVRDGNFSIDGLLGFDMHGRTVGIIGTGKIGGIVAQILSGFGCTIIAYDAFKSAECEALGVTYVELDELLAASDIVTLHCPLTPKTHHLIDEKALNQMKRGSMLVNTSRGEMVDSAALISAVKSGQLGWVGLDVYEEEGDVFFEDISNLVLQDDVLARLMTFPNVLITSHQGFFTREAMEHIAETTFANASSFTQGEPIATNIVGPELARK